MQIQANGERNITLDFDAPKKFKLLQNGVEVPYLRTGKNSVRLSKAINGLLDLEEIPEAPKSIVKPMQLQPQQMALVNPADVVSINQAAQQLEIEQNILSENQKRFENVQNYVDIQQQRIDETVNAVKELETDNANRITATEQSIFNLAGGIAKVEEDTASGFGIMGSELQAHKDANNPHNITKETIGLDKVDNTADIDKPISRATKEALEEKADKDEIEQIREEIAEYQDKNEKINNALANYTGGIGGNELPIGGLTGQVLAKKSDENGDYEWISSSAVPGDGILTLQKNGTNIGTFSANTTSNKTINITVPTQASDVNALPNSTKYGASLNLAIDSSTFVITGQLKDQDGNNLGTAQTIDLPLESVVVNGSYDSANKKIILTLQNGNTVDIPVADLVAGLQAEITASNKLSADLVDDTSTTNKFVTASDKSTWNGKQDTLVSGTNIKTINSTSILGSGDIAISAPTYTAGTGIDITSNTISVTAPTLTNKATGTNSVTIAGNNFNANQSVNVGAGSKANGNAVAYGYNTLAMGGSSVAIGNNASSAGSNSTVVGYGAEATTSTHAIAIGAEAISSASMAIQLGRGTNSTAQSLSVGFGTNASDNYQLLDGTTGLIPDARISTNIARTSAIPSAYGAGLSYSSSSLQLLDQNGNNLGSAVTIKSTPDLDGVTIDTNSDDELEAIGVIDNNGNAIKTWTGTLAQYNAIVTKDSNTLYNITDDVSITQTILEALYPVGSLYIGKMSTCPLASLISGSTWTLVASDKVLQGSGTYTAGTSVSAGLPNITGYRGNDIYQTSGDNSGALYVEGTVSANWLSGLSTVQTSTSFAWRRLGFDASRSNSIYGNSTTVQPPAYVVNIWERTA